MKITKDDTANIDIAVAFYSLVITIPVAMVILIAISPAQAMVLDLWANVDKTNPFYSDWLVFCITTAFSWWSILPIMMVVMAFVYLILTAIKKQSSSQERVRRDGF